MIKNLLIILFTLISINTYSQEEVPKLPIDSITKKITYSGVVITDSLSKDEIFTRSREWFAKTYKSSTSVIQMEDSKNGKIVGKALMQVYHKNWMGTFNSGYINYTITIYIKEGKYKYEFTNFHHTGELGRQPDYGLCESMIKTDKFLWQKIYNYYLTQMDINIKLLITDLNKSINRIDNNNW